jgi:hypothetical protein
MTVNLKLIAKRANNMSKLNMNKPYGVISGKYDQYPSAKFYQEGEYFNARKEKVGGERITPKPTVSEIEKANIKAQMRKEIEAELRAEMLAEIAGGADEVTEGVEETETTELVMDKTDDELIALASQGMAKLRAYAAPFGANGTAKKEIIAELIALRK